MRSAAALALGVTLFLTSVIVLLSMAVGAVSADRYGPLIPGRGVTTIPAPAPTGGPPMPEPYMVSPLDAGDVERVLDIQIGIPDSVSVHELALPAARPLAGLVIRAEHIARHDGHNHTFLVPRQVLAHLAGCVAAWRDRLPVDQRDQFDAQVALSSSVWARDMPDA